jgi:5'(3')-deoxyribonucleotidase
VVDNYFNDVRFFDNLEYMDNAYEVLNRLKENYAIYCVSMGNTVNLALKNTWLRKNLPFVEFIGCNFNEVEDKRHIDMSGGILIDDVVKNLETSNADVKLLFGDEYQWNDKWDGIRCYNWYDVEKELRWNY